jgi:hypothetical protein
VRQAISAAVSLHPDAEFDVYSAVPAALTAPGFDGLIVFVTSGTTEVESDRHAVYGVLEARNIPPLHNHVQRSGQLTPDVLKQFTAFKLGEVSFERGQTDRVADDNSLTKVAEEWVNRVGSAAVGEQLIVKLLHDDLNTATLQLKVIRDRLSPGTTVPILAGNSSHPLPDNCRFASFLAADVHTP